MAKAEQTAAAATTTPVEIPKTRSPNYPTYGLKTAIEKVKVLYEAFKRHPIPVKAVVEKMGFSYGSSTAAQALAAVKAYGLVEVQGNGNERKVSVSEDAVKIIVNHPESPKLLQKAALAPKIYKEIADKFLDHEGLAPDESIGHYLTIDRPEGKFNDKVVDTFLRQFKSTLAFAKVETSGKMSGEHDSSDQDDLGGDDEVQRPSVGDYVQWVSGGVAQFKTPKRVAGFDPSDEYAFLEGEKCGVLIRELTVEKKGDGPMQQEKHAPKNPLYESPPLSGVPISVVMGKGAAQVITIPQMTTKAFEFFKKQLDAFAEAIVKDEGDSDGA